MKGGNYIVLLAVLYGSAFLAGFNENLVNMGLMSIMDEYGVGSVTAQWLVTGYMIVATVVVMCMAFLYRRFKLRTLFFAGAAFCVVGSLMGLVAMSFPFLLIARLVQAVGTGVFIPLMMNTILVVTPKNKLGTFISIGGCMITVGPALAPVVCGGLVTAFGWHSIFVVPLVAMAVLSLLGLVFVRNLDTSEAHLDAPSVALSAVFLFTLSFGLAELTLNLVLALVSLAVAVASAVAFVVRQVRCPYPLIDMTPMKSIRFWPAVLLVVVAMMTTFSLSMLLPLYFEGALGMSAFTAGIIILVPVLANAGCTLVAGRIMDAKGEWPLIPLGFAVVALGALALAFAAPALSAPAMFAAALLVYAGIGLVFSPSQTAGLRTLPPQQNPFGVALMSTFIQIAACIGPSMFTGIMSSAQASALAGGAEQTVATAQGFTSAIEVAACIAAGGFVVALVYALAARHRATSVTVPADSREAGSSQAGSGELASAGLAAVMQPEPYTLAADARVRDAVRELVSRKTGGIPLVDGDGRLAGFVSDGDIMRYLADRQPVVTNAYALIEAANDRTLDERLRELMGLPVSDIATAKVVTLDVRATLKDACQLLAQHRIKKVPVVDGGRVVGVVNRSDVMRYAMESYLEAEVAGREPGGEEAADAAAAVQAGAPEAAEGADAGETCAAADGHAQPEVPPSGGNA